MFLEKEAPVDGQKPTSSKKERKGSNQKNYLTYKETHLKDRHNLPTLARLKQLEHQLSRPVMKQEVYL